MIEATAILYDGKVKADCCVSISGNATITKALMQAEGGQAILDRAMDIMKKEINEHEEKRSK